MSEIQVFDHAALKQRVTDSVRASFGMLIPEEQWKGLIEREVKAFFEESTEIEIRHENKGYGYCNDRLVTKVTPLRALVWANVNDLVQQELRKRLDGENFKAVVIHQMDVVSDSQLSAALDAKLDQLAPVMAKAMLSNLFAGAVERSKMDMINEIQKNR